MRAAIPHSHYKTVTLIAGLRLRGLTAARTFDGPINAALFEDWVETCLVPTLSPGETVVMDNLPAHKGPRVEQLIKAAGAQLRYLPAYSPDMNPIEEAFSKPKAFLRKIAERTVAGLLRALETCAEIFKPSECTNYFKSCGYQDYIWRCKGLKSLNPRLEMVWPGSLSPTISRTWARARFVKSL